MSILKPLIVILGPTSSGKTELSLKLAKKYNGEIINADSRQIYREMMIGTGSPLEVEKDNDNSCKLIDKIPHHLLGITKPNQKFTLSEYQKIAIKRINDIHGRNKIPILVGGTGLYISSIVDNLVIPKSAPDNKIREKLQKHSDEYLFGRLEKIDPKSAQIIGPNNKRKLVRALEVYELTGKPFSSQQAKGKSLFEILQVGIKTNREKLYEKIDRRVDEMIRIGLIEETKSLIAKYSQDLPAMSGIGYFEISSYLEGRSSLDESIQRMKFRTHQYARRQMTWFKKDKRIKWIETFAETEELVKVFLDK